MKKNDTRTSLEKSHNPWSNAKLTLVCLIGSIGFSGLFIVLGLRDVIASTAVFALSLAVAALMTLLSIVLINNFKR